MIMMIRWSHQEIVLDILHSLLCHSTSFCPRKGLLDAAFSRRSEMIASYFTTHFNKESKMLCVIHASGVAYIFSKITTKWVGWDFPISWFYTSPLYARKSYWWKKKKRKTRTGKHVIIWFLSTVYEEAYPTRQLKSHASRVLIVL